MTLNHEKIKHIFKPIQLMFQGELHCLQGFLEKRLVRRTFKLV